MTVFYVGAACLVAGFIAGLLVMRNNVSTANKLLASAKNDLAIAQSTISQFRGATTKPAA